MTKLPILIGSERLRRLAGLPAGGAVMVPGCLTSESEERETWTAESLRAASSNGEGFLASQDFLLRAKMRPDETSAVDVSGQHPLRKGAKRGCDVSRTSASRARDGSGTSSNVVISREKFSSNLRV